jgi:hypothetical protein
MPQDSSREALNGRLSNHVRAKRREAFMMKVGSGIAEGLGLSPFVF